MIMHRFFKALIVSFGILIPILSNGSLQAENKTSADSDMKATHIEKELPTKAVKVGTRIIKPFVFEENGVLTGFSIDLWREISLGIDLKSEFDIHETLDEMLDAVKDGKDVLAISAISITSKREAIFDFSQPMFNSGLGILVPSAHQNGIFAFLGNVNLKDVLKVFGVIFLLVVIPCHIIWFDQRNKDDFEIAKAYFPGIFDAAFWMITLLGGQVEGYPKSYLARFIGATWVFISIFFIVYFTAAMTTALTVQQLKGDINGPSDLKGKRVATIQDSTAASYLKGIGSTVIPFENIDGAVEAVRHGQAVAVVYDSPVLLYYSSHDDSGSLQIVGDTFKNENYGIVFPPNSHLIKKVNEQLLQLRENGVYQSLYQKWFGSGGESQK